MAIGQAGDLGMIVIAIVSTDMLVDYMYTCWQ